MYANDPLLAAGAALHDRRIGRLTGVLLGAMAAAIAIALGVVR